jgi:hypothetical protein
MVPRTLRELKIFTSLPRRCQYRDYTTSIIGLVMNENWQGKPMYTENTSKVPLCPPKIHNNVYNRMGNE